MHFCKPSALSLDACQQQPTHLWFVRRIDTFATGIADLFQLIRESGAGVCRKLVRRGTTPFRSRCEVGCPTD
jgi:hypothetical protein